MVAHLKEISIAFICFLMKNKLELFSLVLSQDFHPFKKEE